MKQTTRNWLDLPSDVMANILSRVGVIEILWNVQIVCTKWHKTCKDPYVWRVIFIENNFYYRHRPYTWPSCLPISALSWKATVETCKHAVDRSEGQWLDITTVDFWDDELLQYIADRADYSFEETSIFHETLLREDIEALGCYCPMLKTLKLNQHFGNLKGTNIVGYELAMAIVENLPKLRHLELTWHFLCNSMLRAILDGCRHLQVLDLRVCEPVVLKGELRKRCLEQIRSLKLPTDSQIMM
ncbi:putative F-box/LRR-repeat protein 23 [Tanacetum coccineum]